MTVPNSANGLRPQALLSPRNFSNRCRAANIEKTGMKRVRPTGILWWKAATRASRDYSFARGTAHLKQIDRALENLQGRIEDLHEQIYKIRMRITQLETERTEKLRSALLQQIVYKGIREIPGIGPALAQEILSRCYDGTLESLSRAYLCVRGIGEKRQLAINAWLRSVQSRLPTLLKQDFPHKVEIIERYRERIEQLKQTAKPREDELAGLVKFQREVLEEINWLRTVSPNHFVRAYEGDREARELVTRYLLGLFPPWDEPPGWFRRLLEEFG